MNHGNSDLRHLLSRFTLTLETNRLILEPVNEAHAPEMVKLLADPDLHVFVPSNPPTLDKLRSQYKYWESRISPQEDELWLNWIARLKLDGKVVGHFQVGVAKSLTANIAYTVSKDFQRRGFASEGLAAIFDLLFDKLQAKSIKAWIDTRNEASIALVKKMGMTQVEFIAKADHFKGMDSDEYVFYIGSTDLE